MPFLLPLLYQLGLGYSPIQSGLLIMPQSIAAIALKFLVPSILVAPRLSTRVGHTIRRWSASSWHSSRRLVRGHRTWLIVLQACVFGFLQSLQFTSMNTLVYADVDEVDTSMTSTIVSTVQQMSLSFGVAVSSLVTGYFIPDRLKANTEELLHGLHHAFIFLGLMTALTALCFKTLKDTDGENISQHRADAHFVLPLFR